MNSKSRSQNHNVFREVGFSEAEATNLRIRADMMNVLISHIEKEGWTQAQAARHLHVTQPRISNLMRGKIQLFSIDTLVNLLAAAGLQVGFRIRRAA